MQRRFRVPDDLEFIAKGIMIAIVYGIPREWAIVTGGLTAPKWMLDSGEALASTNLMFGSQINQMIVKSENEQTADIFGVLIEGKKPKEIDFGPTFGHCEVMPMEQSKRMISHFLNLGYRGRIDFKWRNPDHREKVLFRCEIWLPTIQGSTDAFCMVESNDEEQLERGKTVAPIIAICENLKLEELETKE